MRKIAFIACFLMLTVAVPVFAEQAQPSGAGENGFKFSLGYDGAYMHYSENQPSGTGVFDKENGWLNGLSAELRYDRAFSYPLFARVKFDYINSNHVKYIGGLQGGGTFTPYNATTPDTVYKTEFNFGYKIWNPAHFSLAPYIGVGYRDWVRGQDVLPDYEETYSWWYGAIGLEAKYRATKRLLAGVDAALFLPFDQKMKTSVAHTIDTATFHIKSRPGWRVDVPLSYDVYTTRAGHFIAFVFLTPYYEHWNIGQSQTVTLTINGSPTINGQPVGTALEPTSHTDLYGAKAGIGVNF